MLGLLQVGGGREAAFGDQVPLGVAQLVPPSRPWGAREGGWGWGAVQGGERGDKALLTKMACLIDGLIDPVAQAGPGCTLELVESAWGLGRLGPRVRPCWWGCLHRSTGWGWGAGSRRWGPLAPG